MFSIKNVLKNIFLTYNNFFNITGQNIFER